MSDGFARIPDWMASPRLLRSDPQQAQGSSSVDAGAAGSAQDVDMSHSQASEVASAPEPLVPPLDLSSLHGAAERGDVAKLHEPKAGAPTTASSFQKGLKISKK